MPPVTDIRDLLRLTMALTATDEAESHNATYRAVRPSSVPTLVRRYTRDMRWTADCSSGARDVCWFTPGAPDPFQNGWAPYGNSSTIWAKLHHEDDHTKCEIGDFFTFGYRYGEKHVAMVYDISDPKNPRLWNFGRPGEPIITDLATEAAYHRGMIVTLCKAQIIDPPPTPQDKLRALTGFYAWLSWREGFNVFSHYGPRNRSVRPSVPRRIVPIWWTRRARFLANRKRPNRTVKKAK